MKKFLIFTGILGMMPVLFTACTDDSYCYREGIYIFDSYNNVVLQCNEGLWETDRAATVPEACHIVCLDEDSKKANHEWCDNACANFIHSSEN